MEIGAIIRQRRKELGYTVDQIAEFLGVNRVTYYRYENGGIKTIPYNYIIPLAKKLRIFPGELFEFKQAAKTRDALLEIMEELNEGNRQKVFEFAENQFKAQVYDDMLA